MHKFESCSTNGKQKKRMGTGGKRTSVHVLERLYIRPRMRIRIMAAAVCIVAFSFSIFLPADSSSITIGVVDEKNLTVTNNNPHYNGILLSNDLDKKDDDNTNEKQDIIQNSKPITLHSSPSGNLLADGTIIREKFSFPLKEKENKLSMDAVNASYQYYYDYHSSVTDRTYYPQRSRSLRYDHRLQPLQQCKIALGVGDSDRNDVLSKDEYLNFVNQMARNRTSPSKSARTSASTNLDTLSTALDEYYDSIADNKIGGINISGSKPGQGSTIEQDGKLKELCESTKSIVLDTMTQNINDMNNGNNNGTLSVSVYNNNDDVPAAPMADGTSTIVITFENWDCTETTYDRGQCNVDLSISDDYQNDLLDRSDYVRFVNRISDDEYDGMEFQQLPQNVQDNYNKFATKDGQVDISGSKPGQRVSVEQDLFLDAFCCETDWVLQNPGMPKTLEPTAAPQPSDSQQTSPPTFDLFFCQRSMASSDLDRDDRLDEDEYIIFLNRLTGNEFIDITSLDELDVPLQNNFNNLAGNDGQIDIYGSKPGQSIEGDNSLTQICLDTAMALSVGSIPTVAPTTSEPSPGSSVDIISIPTAEPSSENLTVPPNIHNETEPNSCHSFMASADSDGDNYLDEIEYVQFVNGLSDDEFSGMAFPNLPTSLQSVYEDLKSENGTGIYIYGSKPEDDADEEQENFLQRVCDEAAAAIDNQQEPTQSPTMPTPPSADPTFPPGLSEVYNSFIIANKNGLTAESLPEASLSRKGLDEAYMIFAEESTNSIKSANRRLLTKNNKTNLRRRKLEVEYLPNSNIIYLIEDSDCPDNVLEGEICQTAFAKFRVTITDDEDAKVISEEYTIYTQGLIMDGNLDNILKEEDPMTLLRIVTASEPPFPPDDIEVSMAPSDAPTVVVTEEKKKSLAGPIVGGVLGVLLLLLIAGYVVIKCCPFSVSGGGRVGNKDDDDDYDGGLDYGQEDDDASIGEKSKSFGKVTGFGAENSGTFGNDYAEEKEQGIDEDKNVFGFTKKNKKNDEDDNEFGFGSPTNPNTNSFGGSDDMYGFDEPSEVDSDTDDQDQGSVGDNQDNIFGDTSSSPGWDNTDTVFGLSTDQGWGANGGENNFFGSSAFGDEKNDDQFSKSGSESESDFTSEDETYESGEHGDSEEFSGEGSVSGSGSRSFGMDEDEQQDSYSGSSADDDSFASKSLAASQMNTDLRMKNEDMDAAIESGDWDAVVKAANSFDKSDQESSVAGSSKIGSFSQDGNEDNSYSDSYSDASATSATTATEELERRAEFRSQVDALVRQVLPDETEKVDAMMDQFKGREAELVSTLQTMKERNNNAKARALVHKSKAPQQQNGAQHIGGGNGAQGGEGSTAGNAAIAAASLPIPASGMFDNENEDDNFDMANDADFDRENDEFMDESYSEDYDEDGSYYSNEDDRSYFSDEGSRSENYEDGSYYSNEDDRSYFSDEGSRSENHEDGSYYSNEDERSFYSDDGSYSGEEEGSYYSGEEGSYHSDQKK